jgi:aerobic-type carbon monoxide dehydrogenase small subunit (CoxS/CutS family)
MRLAFRLNGRTIEEEIPDHELLIDLLRERLGLTGTKMSCEVQVCGACAVLVDGQPVSSCCMLAADVQDREVLTIEGLRELPEFVTLERAFLKHFATQCGFCTPGFMLTAMELVSSDAPLTPEDLRGELAGNICRCTGYSAILRAIQEAVGVA